MHLVTERTLPARDVQRGQAPCVRQQGVRARRQKKGHHLRVPVEGRQLQRRLCLSFILRGGDVFSSFGIAARVRQSEGESNRINKIG